VDFANTVYAPGNPGGALGGFDDIVAFLEASEAVSSGEARCLRARARTGPRRARIALSRALALREVLRGILAALVAGEPVRRPWVEFLNGILRSDPGYAQLVAREDGWSLAPMVSGGDPLGALVPIARSAAELIQEGPGASVRKCANPKCVLYFYDASPTGQRRWCSMAVCGNRMKVAAHARRGRRRA
jgi:predicted RNA-binding Zn ribbon-like protein